MNIMNYENKKHATREGSEVDVERLERLFTQLGFDVELWPDLTKPVSLFQSKYSASNYQVTHYMAVK